MIKRRTRRGIYVLAVLAIASGLVSRNPSDSTEKPLARIDTRLNYALHDFEGRLLDELGNINLEISSPVLRKNAESEVGTIESPVIRIQQENELWYISAESAIITADREYVSLIGKVEMSRQNELTGETLEISTRDVMLNITPRTASTESLVSINQAGDHLEALGMNLDMINDSYELLENVQAHYDIP
jgi:LPS export ABC transporter protein LptC